MCEWCGHDHPVTALCVKRPRWSRRGFLALLGVGVAGLALAPTLDVLAPPQWAIGTRAVDQRGNVYRYIKAARACQQGDGVFITNHNVPNMFGVATERLKPGECGWVQTYGQAWLNTKPGDFARPGPVMLTGGA